QFRAFVQRGQQARGDPVTIVTAPPRRAHDDDGCGVGLPPVRVSEQGEDHLTGRFEHAPPRTLDTTRLSSDTPEGVFPQRALTLSSLRISLPYTGNSPWATAPLSRR